jgi:hypothetical protein
MSPEQQSADRLARIETNIASMAETLKRIADDHEHRIRYLEAENLRQSGVLKLVAWLGAPGAAAVVLFLATRAH